jgi:hypothetical protein
MNDWIMISATMVMCVSLLGAVGLAVIAWRRRATLRGLEAREQGGLGTSAPVATDRVQALASRDGVSQGGVAATGSAGHGPLIGVVVAATLLIVAGGATGWWFLLRDTGATAAVVATPIRPANAPMGSDPASVVPDNPPAIQDRAAYTVAVLNASGVTGAAANTVAPKVETAGYRVGEVGDANDQDLGRSVVMWRDGKQAIAQNVAKDLGITSAPPLDGIGADAVGEADVVVVVGKDAASAP